MHRGVHAYDLCVCAHASVSQSGERKTDWHVDRQTVKEDKGDCIERERINMEREREKQTGMDRQTVKEDKGDCTERERED